MSTETEEDLMHKISTLESRLEHSFEKVRMRDTVISQLEEEIRAKEELISEQSNLIDILECEHGERERQRECQALANNAFMLDLESLHDENDNDRTTVSAITIIPAPVRERVPDSGSSDGSSSGVSCDESHFKSPSPLPLDPPYPGCSYVCHPDEDVHDRLHKALVERERVEMQNEQLLRQWEASLECLDKVQAQLRLEMARSSPPDQIVIHFFNERVALTRGIAQLFAAFFIALFAFLCTV